MAVVSVCHYANLDEKFRQGELMAAAVCLLHARHL
jgi:hypothetical protein